MAILESRGLRVNHDRVAKLTLVLFIATLVGICLFNVHKVNAHATSGVNTPVVSDCDGE